MPTSREVQDSGDGDKKPKPKEVTTYETEGKNRGRQPKTGPGSEEEE